MGQIISLFGTQMRFVAITFQVFQITGSTLAVGLISLTELVPLIVFSIVGGALADSFDRRRIMAVAQVGLLLNASVLAVLTLAGTSSLLAIFVLAATGGALEAIERPARTAMLPSLVRPDQLSAAVALRQVVYQTTHIAGPALGGVLIALVGNVGWVYALDGLTFLAALVALKWVPFRAPGPRESDAGISLDSIRHGLAYALRTPVILSIFVIDLVAMIFGMPRAVFPELALETFGLGSTGLGLLYAAPSAGALIGALTTGWVTRVERHGLAVVAAVTVWGAAIALAGLSLFSLGLTLFWLAVAGGADVISAVFRGTILLQATPDSLRGRVNALNQMVVTGGPRVGDVEAGLLAGAIGAGPSVVVGGVATLAGTGAVAAVFRSMRRYRSGEGRAAPTGPEPR